MDATQFVSFTEQRTHLQTQIDALKVKLKDLDVTLKEEYINEAVVANYQIAKKYLDEYPFFTLTQGASGYLDTGKSLSFLSLSFKAVTTKIASIQVWRTTIAREYLVGDTTRTSTPNYPNSRSMGAGSAAYTWHGGDLGYSTIATQYKDKIIKDVVKLQEDTLKDTKTSAYPKTDFSDLLTADFTYNEALDNYNIRKAEVQTELSNTLTEKNEELLEVLQQIQALTTQAQERLQNAQEALQKTQDELDALQSAQKANIQQLEQLEAQMQQAQQELSEKEALLNTLQDTSDLAQKQQELQEIQAQITQKDQELQNAQETRTNIETQITQSRAQLTQTEQELQTLQSQLEQLEAQMQQAQQELSEKEALLNTLQDTSDLAQKQQELQEIQAQITQKDQELQNAQETRTNIETQITRSRAQLTQTEQQLQTMQKELEDLQTQDLDALLAEKQEQLEQIQTQITHFSENMGANGAEYKEIQAQITQKQQELLHLEQGANNIIQTAREQLADLQTQYDNGLKALELMANESNAQIAEKREQLQNSLNEQLMQTQAQIEEKRKELLELENADLETLEKELLQLNLELEALRNDDGGEALSNALTQRKKIKEEIAQLELQNAEYNNNKSGIFREYERLKEWKNKLMDTNNLLSIEIDDLLLKISDTNTEMQELKETQENLLSELRVLQGNGYVNGILEQILILKREIRSTKFNRLELGDKALKVLGIKEQLSDKLQKLKQL